MLSAIYNSHIPAMLNRGIGVAHVLRTTLRISSLVIVLSIATQASDWSVPEQQLTRKIIAVTGPGAVTLTMVNRSSLGSRDVAVINNGLRIALESAGLHFVKPDQAAASVAISLSENASSRVWVAEIRQDAGDADATVVMVSVPREAGAIVMQDSVPLTIRKILLWAQNDQILDVAVLEENTTPTRIAVLEAEEISLYRWLGGKWQSEQTLSLPHTRPWPRDLRGRLVPAKDHLLDAYLPGVICRITSGMALTMNCRESDDPWPLTSVFKNGFSSINTTSVALSVPPMSAFFASTRNFYTGALAPGVGKFTTVPKFYSAAYVPREKYVLWLFSAVDGQLHMVDGVSDVSNKLAWGSDIATINTSCGSGFQVLASSAPSTSADSIRAYEFPGRDAVPVSDSLDLAGEVTALWTEAKGDTAIAVTRNRQTGSYETFRLAVACNQ